MGDKDTTNSTFFQLFKSVLSRKIWRKVKQELANLDKYAKKLKTYQLVILVMLSQLEKLSCLDEISKSLNRDELSQQLGLDSISASQISRRIRALSPIAFQILFRTVIAEMGTTIGYEKIRQELGRLCIIDASVITLCLSRYRWAEFRETKGAVKMHTRVELWDIPVPTDVIVTNGKTSDKSQMDDLVVKEAGVINVFDRGYVDYEIFDDYCENGILFVTRLKNNAHIDVEEEFEVTEDSPIEEDLKVRLGSVSKRMKHSLRLIVTHDSEGHAIMILTNIWDKSAEEIGDIYRYRWQVEIFFKWIKQHMEIKHFYGLSETAVINQVLAALTAYILLKLLSIKAGWKGSLLAIQRHVKVCLYYDFSSFLQKLYAKHGKSSQGRKKLKHEEIYALTEKQIMDGDTDWMYDPTLDPVIM